MKKFRLNGYACYFSVGFNTNDFGNILDIHKFLKKKNGTSNVQIIKQAFIALLRLSV